MDIDKLFICPSFAVHLYQIKEQTIIITLLARLSAFGSRLFLSLLLSLFILAGSLGHTDPELTYRGDVIVTVADSAAQILVYVEGSLAVPYQMRITKPAFGFAIVRDGQVVLASAQNAFSAERSGSVTTGAVLYQAFTGTQLILGVAASDGGAPYSIILTPRGDRVTWLASLPGASQVTLSLDLASGGHWYGHGEGGNDASLWPLDNPKTAIHDANFGPSSYDMDEPFWFTSKATGLWVDTSSVMAVSIDGTTGGTNRADFTVKSAGSLRAVTFIERTPRDVYFDYIGIAGKPEKSDAPVIQYTEPVWNTWAMYNNDVTQADVVGYAQNIKAAGLGGYAIQIDDRWSSKYGDFTFDPQKFPDPAAMSGQIHDLGFDLGLWMTLWINPDADNYPIARDAGYLLKSAADPSQPCKAHWWHGDAGMIDLANPAAVDWFRGKLRALESTYAVQGFKFDTTFFDSACAATGGLTAQDYQRLGAKLADEFNLQGVGIRVHWTGQQKYGFIARAQDATPDFNSQGLGRSVRQVLALNILGYPFATTDMVGGSAGGNPTDEVLVRWAQAEVALPLWYASTSPAGPFTLTRAYKSQTVDLYRAALDKHRALAPYILKQARRAVAEGEPIVKPLFFNYPEEELTYTLSNEWLLGDAVLSAPVTTSATSRNIYLPAGHWYDVNQRATLVGPRLLKNYPAPLSVLPLFINLDDPDGQKLVGVFK